MDAAEKVRRRRRRTLLLLLPSFPWPCGTCQIGSIGGGGNSKFDIRFVSAAVYVRRYVYTWCKKPKKNLF